MEDIEPRQRAGYWRRTLSAALDMLVVALPASLIMPVLYNVSGGALQATTGLGTTICRPPTEPLPPLDPPPPANSTFAEECTSYTLGGVNFHTIDVGRVEKSGTSTSSFSRSYLLAPDGHVVQGHDITWIGAVVLLAYVIEIQRRRGQTLGQQLTRTRLVADLAFRRVPLRQLATRYAVMVGVYVVPFLVFFGAVGFIGFDKTPPTLWGPLLVACSLIWIGWSLWNVVRIVRRRPAVYDRIARLEVISVHSAAPQPTGVT